MKYLITFLLAFVTIIGYSQPLQLRSGGSVTPLDSNLMVGKALRVPVFEDTTNANTYRTLDSAGKVIFTRADNNVWIRTTEKAWSLIGVGGSYIDSIWVSDDRTAYIYGKAATEVGRVSTLMTTFATEPGSGLTLRTNTQLDSVFIGGGGTMRTTSYLVSTGGVVLADSTLTVTQPTRWVYKGADSIELTNQVFTINTAATGDLRTDIIWIDSLGVFTKTVGTPDSVTAVAPMIDYNGIIVAYADIDGSTITVNGVSSFQGNGVVYTQGVGVNNGQAKTDSINLGYNETTRNLTVGNTIISNNVNGVAFQGNGGSDIRAVNGSRRWYITADSFITMRSGGLLHMAQLDGQGGFLIGTNGIAKVPSARLAVIDSTRGFLMPAMRTVRMNAITSPANGLQIYNTDSLAPFYYNGSAWVKLGSGGSGTSGWGLTGNSGTDSTVNGIGTTDLQPLYILVDGDTTAKFGTIKNFQSGEIAVASGYASAAFGEGVFASGARSFASGYGNYAQGFVSTAMGISSTASGENSVAIGSSAQSTNVNSFSFGSNAQSTGEDAVAIGHISLASGQNSSAFGYSSTANGLGSTAIGHNAVANTENETAIGVGVTVKTDTTIINNISRFAGNQFIGVGKVPTAIDTDGNWTWQTPGGGSLTRGTTAITSGTSTRVLYDSAGIVGEYGISGTGSVAMTASPTFTGLITSPALTLTSTTTGFIPNSVTTTQMNAITPTNGMMVYNTDEGSMFTYNTDWGWESNSVKYNTVFGTQYFNDLLGIIPAATAATQDGNIAISTSGGAVTTFTTPTANRQGIIELSTSTSATGRSYIATSNQTTAQSMVLGGGRILYETSVQVPTLSTSGERFAFIAGFTSALNNITIPNGASFLYDEGGVATGSAASANWQVLTGSSGSRTYTTTSTVVTAGQWYKLQVIVNAAATSVGFYIDGTLVHTETSTIPTAAIGFANQIIKSNGTTARTVLVDYVYLKQKYTTAK